MIRTVFLIIIILLCYGIAFWMISRVFIIALTFNSSAPFVPSSKAIIKKILELFELEIGDKVVDIGSGDGRFVLYAAKKYPRVKFYGIEQNKFLVWFSNAKKKFLKIDNAEFICGKAEDQDISSYNKIYMYMPDFFVAKLLDSIEGELQEGTVVMNAVFGFGEEFTKTHDIKEYTFTAIGKKGRISQWNK